MVAAFYVFGMLLHAASRTAGPRGRREVLLATFGLLVVVESVVILIWTTDRTLDLGPSTVSSV